MKKYVILLVFFVLSMGMLRSDILYIGNSHSHKYHYLGCKSSKRISTKNIVYFYSIEEAIKSGFEPCKICKPPTFDNTGVAIIKTATINYERE